MSAEITEEKDVMSGPEAEEFIEELKKVFSIVRLLDKDNFEHMEREQEILPCRTVMCCFPSETVRDLHRQASSIRTGRERAIRS